MAIPLLSACGSDGAGGETVVTDSAGVRIVRHPASAEAPAWTVDFAAGTRIGGTASSTELHRVRGALRLGDGRIVVADAGNDRVVFFDSAGALLHAVGRDGEGPGEFRDIRFVARWRADSLVAYDSRLRRLSVLSPSGQFARTFALESTEEVPASVNGVYADGSFMATGFVDVGPDGPTTGRHSYPSADHHFDATGRFVTTTGSFPSGESYFETLDGGFRIHPVVFSRRTDRLVAGDRLLVARADRYELRYLRRDGSLEQIVRREPLARPATAEARRTEIDALLADQSEEAAERMRVVLEDMEAPDVLPEMEDLFADRLGRVWVEVFEPGSPPMGRWHVYGEDGLLLAGVSLPAAFELTDAGTDYVVGVMTDEVGLETVVVAPLETPPATQ